MNNAVDEKYCFMGLNNYESKYAFLVLNTMKNMGINLYNITEVENWLKNNDEIDILNAIKSHNNDYFCFITTGKKSFVV